jgi:CRP/FNR family cyclic AMP-dependent transcriptional regulator
VEGQQESLKFGPVTGSLSVKKDEGRIMIENVSLFVGLQKEVIAAIEGIATKRIFPKGTIVISEGDQSDSLYIVIKGKANAIRDNEEGKQIVLNVFRPLDYFGEMSFFDKECRSATVITKEQSEFLIIPRKDFWDIMHAHPDIALNLVRLLVEKMRKATRQIEELAFMDVYGRVARFLTETVNDQGVIVDKITHQEIANMVGSSRETVTRIMNELIDRGYIIKKDRQIRLLKKLPYQP